jgi:SEC-C motif-containing protein
MEMCLCHSGKLYLDCCGIFLSEEKFAETPEQLMRSRYSAYVSINIDYIARTMRGPAAKGFNKPQTEAWARQVKWLELKVLQATREKDSGLVEFIASYVQDGVKQQMHEVSEFQRTEGKWYYVNGKKKSMNKIAGIPVKIGRNDLCPCGSHKKFKKCCAEKSS